MWPFIVYLDGKKLLTGAFSLTCLTVPYRVTYSHQIFAALGHTDELNSFIGLAREHCVDAKNGLEGQLEEIQCRLLELGSHIATPRDSGNEGRLRTCVVYD